MLSRILEMSHVNVHILLMFGLFYCSLPLPEGGPHTVDVCSLGVFQLGSLGCKGQRLTQVISVKLFLMESGLSLGISVPLCQSFPAFFLSQRPSLSRVFPHQTSFTSSDLLPLPPDGLSLSLVSGSKR